MRVFGGWLTVALAASLLAAAAPAKAQGNQPAPTQWPWDQPLQQRLKAEPKAWLKRTVEIVAHIEGLAERPDTEYLYYVIEDNFGSKCLVMTKPNKGYPSKGALYRIVGEFYSTPDGSRLITDRPTGWPILLDFGRQKLTKPYPGPWHKADEPAAATGTAASGPAVAQGTQNTGLNPLLLVVIGASAVLLLAVGGVAVMILRNNNASNDMIYVDGQTMKCAVGTTKAIEEGTVKVLPGRFEVLAGDNGIQELKLFQTKDNPSREYTLGRVMDGVKMPLNHIGFKSPTVSRQQGRIQVSSQGEYTIVNVASASSNPTVVANRVLGENESTVLQDGDEIQIGEVRLKYHAR